jgi:hypothetical protein
VSLPALVGEAPSRTGDRYHAFPLSGRVAEALCRMACIPPRAEGTRYGRWTWALYERFLCGNLFERYHEAYPWSAPSAREAWSRMRAEAPDLLVVVALGRRVQAALDLPSDLPYHRWVDQGGLMVATVPHPSGLNRILNDRGEREICGETLREAMRLAERRTT